MYTLLDCIMPPLAVAGWHLFVRKLLRLIKTTRFPISGITLLWNTPGKSVDAVADSTTIEVENVAPTGDTKWNKVILLPVTVLSLNFKCGMLRNSAYGTIVVIPRSLVQYQLNDQILHCRFLIRAPVYYLLTASFSDTVLTYHRDIRIL